MLGPETIHPNAPNVETHIDVEFWAFSVFSVFFLSKSDGGSTYTHGTHSRIIGLLANAMGQEQTVMGSRTEGWEGYERSGEKARRAPSLWDYIGPWCIIIVFILGSTQCVFVCV